MQRTFEIVRLRELLERFAQSPETGGRVRVKEHHLDQTLEYPLPKFGDSMDALGEQPISGTRLYTGQRRMLSPETYLIQNCTVFSKFGAIFVDGYLIRESLFSFPYHLVPEFKFTGELYRETAVTINMDLRSDFYVDHAYSALAGIQGNYYHWLFFVLARLQPLFLDAWKDEIGEFPPLLLPSQLNSFQTESLNALSRDTNYVALHLATRSCVDVGTLAVPVVHRQSGVLPNPVVKAAFSELARKLSPRRLPDQKMYVSRRDTTNRKLENEAEIEDMARRHGYNVVSLSGKTVAEQIALFASATHVISPHGAGLANLVFCRPGTKVLEIHASFYLNWCYRHICAVYDLEYGFIFGHAGEPDKARNGGRVHGISFVLSPSALEAILDSEAFSGALTPAS